MCRDSSPLAAVLCALWSSFCLIDATDDAIPRLPPAEAPLDEAPLPLRLSTAARVERAAVESALPIAP